MAVAAFIMAACAAPTAAPTAGAAGKIGIVLPTKDEPRWIQDETRFKDAASAAGLEVEILFSQGSSATEKQNVESLISKGVTVLIITPQDGSAAAATAEAARAAGVKVISYDRLIRDTEAVDYYVTFDSEAVGAAQAQYLVDHASGKAGQPLYLYAGASSDNNAFLFFHGAWVVLQPKIADGTFVIKNSSEAVALKDKADLTRDEMGKVLGQITTNWDFNTAKGLAESNLTAAAAADKGDVLILAPNDGTARAIADAFGADKDVTSYVVTGQDAEEASVQYIIDGKQQMTVLKDVRVLVKDAFNAAVKFLNGETPEKTTTYNNGKIDVPAKPSAVVAVDKDNVQKEIIDSGYWPAGDFTGLGGAASTGGEAKELKIVSSLPMTGASLTQTQTIANAMQLRLEQANGEACDGSVKLSYEAWDDASAALGKWDPAVETENANKAAADKSIIAYLGTFNSGAAKLSMPILNQAGPLLMLSPANTYPGLTKPGKGEPNEPDVYFPSGVKNYARVVAADDIQGAVAARFVKNELKAATVYILDDQELYGKGVADVFEATATEIGLTVLGHEGIDTKAADYKALMTKISTSNGGKAPDAIYVGMVVDNNASQLLKDKVSIMGDNTVVKFVGPDGIQTQAFIDGAGADVAEGVYASVGGLPFEKLPAAAQQFKKDYDAKFGGDLNEPYAVYGYEAMNVTLAAIEAVCAGGGDPSDREAVRAAVFATKDFDGVLGKWSFDENGDTSLTDMTFYSVQAGKYETVGQFK